MTWISTIEAAYVLEITERAVREQAYGDILEHRYTSGKGRSGKTLQISLESLPPAAQMRYQVIQDKQTSENAEDYLSSYTGKQREAAQKKCGIIRQYQSSGKTGREFVDEYNSSHSEHISTDQLYKWQKKLNNGGLAALVDTRGTHSKGSSTIPEEAWELFCSLYLTHQKRKVTQCYSLVKAQYPDIPSLRTFNRRVQNEITELVKIRYRGTQEQYVNSFPYHVRDLSDLESNERWSSDHHTCDVMVLNKQGKAVALTLTTIVDVRSTKILSYRFRDAPGDTSVIKMCLRDAMIKYGVPLEFYTDNGKDYKSKELSSDDESGLSLTEVLGIKQIFAQPHHGQSKPVERFFESFENELGKWFKSYRGPSPDRRTDETRMTNDKLAQKTYVPTMDEYIAKAAEYIEYYNSERAHTGLNMDGQTPDRVYLDNLHHVRRVDDAVLRLLCGRIAVRTVQRNGVSVGSEFYSNADGALLPYYKKKVIVIRDPEDLFEMVVLNIDTKQYICKVQRKSMSPFSKISEEDIKTTKREIRTLRTYTNSFKPRTISHSELMALIAKKHLLRNNFAEDYEKRQAEISSDPISNPIIDAVAVAAKDNRSVTVKPTEPVKEETQGEEDENFFAAYYNSNKEDMA